MTIAGLFEMGMWEFDMGYMLASLWETRDFCGGAGLEAIQVMTADPYAAETVAAALRARLGPDVRISTWMEQNQQLFAALRVEKNMMFFLLIFITIVAAFGITNTLITVTVQKTRRSGCCGRWGSRPAASCGCFSGRAGLKACWARRWASSPVWSC